MPSNLTFRGNEMAPTAETKTDAYREYSMLVLRSLKRTSHFLMSLCHLEPVHSTEEMTCFRISNLSTVSSISVTTLVSPALTFRIPTDPLRDKGTSILTLKNLGLIAQLLRPIGILIEAERIEMRFQITTTANLVSSSRLVFSIESWEFETYHPG